MTAPHNGSMEHARTPFADLDQMAPPMLAMLMAALEAMSRHPEIRRARETAHLLLAPGPGWRLMDAGCGNGDVARALAADAGPHGSVLALDYSAVTIDAARRRHDGSRVEYVTGDVSALDLPDDGLDGIWCERVLQHVADADRVIAEFTRVTRTGGRVCLIDTDWESLAFDGMPAGLSGQVVRHMHAQFTEQQRDMGRTLRRRLVRAGLTGVRAIPVNLHFDEPSSAAVVLPMVNPNVPAEAGVLPAEIRAEWLDAVDGAGARGEFLATLTQWVVVGTVPAR